MFAKLLSATPKGTEALFVTVEVDRVRAALPSFSIVGLPDTAVREAKDRVLAALGHLGLANQPANTVVNLAPAGERKVGSLLDLPIALGLLATRGSLPVESLDGRLFLGELSLDGRLMPVRGVLPIAMAAASRGVAQIVVPAGNSAEAAVVENLEVLGASSLGEVARMLRGELEIVPSKPQPAPRREALAEGADLAEVVGQLQARRALEIAAAGGHHLLLIGPPGSGKSMLAKRLPGILPPLEGLEALETTAVHSVSLKVPRPKGLLRRRPFRAPHHTASAAALIGGGSDPQPGEISLAHNGVLFLDELTEFRRDVLECLRQPLEDRHVTVVRARGALRFPAGFQLVAAANPCPCGYLGASQRECRCGEGQVVRYQARLSGPLLDRIDLQVQVPMVPWNELGRGGGGEASATVAARVLEARAKQRSRLGEGCLNAGMSTPALRRDADPGIAGRELLERAAAKLGLSARAYHRILRVARTIADLEGAKTLSPGHLKEAIAYRFLDRASAQAQTGLQS